MRRTTTLLATSIAIAAAVDVEPAKLATADAMPLDPGAMEVALGLGWSRAASVYDQHGDAQDRGGDLTRRGLTMGFNAGLYKDLDAGVSIGWSRIRDDAADPSSGSGPTDLGLGAKWRIWQRDTGESSWATALLPSVAVPMGRGQDAGDDIPTASRFWTAGLAAACSGHIGRLALNADVGFVCACGSDEDRAGYRGNTTADVAVGYQMTATIQPELDLSWSRDRVEEGTAPRSLTLTAGAEIGLAHGRLGLGVQRVIDGVQTDRSTTLLAALTIPLQ